MKTNNMEKINKLRQELHFMSLTCDISSTALKIIKNSLDEIESAFNDQKQ
jgi:hypothetical protein